MILLLRLEGPLQSYGVRSRFDDRDTADMPTKSAVMGILASALGYARDDERILTLNDSLLMGVRADRIGTMTTDYQTITRLTGHLIDAEGKERVVPGKKVGESDTIVSKRQYIQDACFTVALFGKDDLLAACARALQAPVWQTYLGRKCCPPSRPLFVALTDAYQDAEDALRRSPLCECVARRHKLHNRLPVSMRCELDDAAGTLVRQDILRTSGVLYGKRRVNTFYIPYKEVDCT